MSAEAGGPPAAGGVDSRRAGRGLRAARRRRHRGDQSRRCRRLRRCAADAPRDVAREHVSPFLQHEPGSGGARGKPDLPGADARPRRPAGLAGGGSGGRGRAMRPRARPARPRSRSPSRITSTTAAWPRCCSSTWCRPARSNGVRTFTAEVLAENSAMLKVFATAGLHARRRQADGVTELAFDLPGDDADPGWEPYLDAVARREGRADVASLRHVFAAESVAVVGASRRPGSVGRAILHNIVSGGLRRTGVRGESARRRTSRGSRACRRRPHCPAGGSRRAVGPGGRGRWPVAEECGARGVGALVVITSGLDLAAREALLDCCRRHGMRLVGPNCLGIAVPGIRLDATFAARHPAAGMAGVAVQSGGVGIALLDQLCPARNRDLLVRLPRRQGRRVRQRPAEVVGAGSGHQAGRALPGVVRQPAQVRPLRPPRWRHHAGPDRGRGPLGGGTARAPRHRGGGHAVTREALFRQAGIIATRDIGELIDAAALLASQPVPAGRPGRGRVQRHGAPGCSPPTPARRGPAHRGAGRPDPGCAAPPAAAGRSRHRPGRYHRCRAARDLPPLPGTGRGRRRRGRGAGAHGADRDRRPGPRGVLR